MQAEGKHRPGIVSWLSRLKSEHLISQAQFRFVTTAVKYGDKDFFVDDVFSDSLSLNADLLTDLGDDWLSRIIDELDATEQLVKQLGYLAQSLAKAAGDSLGDDAGDGPSDAAKEQAYYQLDSPFRQWLLGIDPENGEMSEACDRWWERARRIVRNLGRELVEQSGPLAFIGREIKKKEKGKEVTRRYTAPEAYNSFLHHTATRQAMKGGEKNE
jgi:CRISPR system Cascade subunit CasA